MYSSPYNTDVQESHKKEYVIDGNKVYLFNKEDKKMAALKWAKAKEDCIYMSKKELDAGFVKD